MRACFYEYDVRIGIDSLWYGLGLERQMEQARSVKGPGLFVISTVRVGGETSTIRRLTWEAVRRGLKVLVVTATYMARPGTLEALESSAEETRTVLGCHDLAVAGRLAEKGKIAFTGWELYRETYSLASLVLVGADGSRRLPLKVPRAGESVILDSTDMILCLNGLSPFRKRTRDRCLRLEEARALASRHDRRHYENNHRPWGSATGGLGQDPEDRADWIVQEEDMMTLINHRYLLPLRADYLRADILPVFNQADTLQEVAPAGEVLEGMKETSGAANRQLGQDAST